MSKSRYAVIALLALAVLVVLYLGITNESGQGFTSGRGLNGSMSTQKPDGGNSLGTNPERMPLQGRKGSLVPFGGIKVSVLNEEGVLLEGAKLLRGKVNRRFCLDLLEKVAFKKVDGVFEVNRSVFSNPKQCVYAFSPGYLPSEVSINNIKNNEVSVYLSNGEEFEVVVLDPDGNPLKGVAITASNQYLPLGGRAGGIEDIIEPFSKSVVMSSQATNAKGVAVFSGYPKSTKLTLRVESEEMYGVIKQEPKRAYTSSGTIILTVAPFYAAWARIDGDSIVTQQVKFPRTFYSYSNGERRWLKANFFQSATSKKRSQLLYLCQDRWGKDGKVRYRHPEAISCNILFERAGWRKVSIPVKRASKGMKPYVVNASVWPSSNSNGSVRFRLVDKEGTIIKLPGNQFNLAITPVDENAKASQPLKSPLYLKDGLKKITLPRGKYSASFFGNLHNSVLIRFFDQKSGKFEVRPQHDLEVELGLTKRVVPVVVKPYIKGELANHGLLTVAFMYDDASGRPYKLMPDGKRRRRSGVDYSTYVCTTSGLSIGDVVVLCPRDSHVHFGFRFPESKSPWLLEKSLFVTGGGDIQEVKLEAPQNMESD